MRWLLRLYPRTWRQRYGAELEALLDEGRLTLPQSLDLLRGALEAHLYGRPPGYADDGPRRTTLRDNLNLKLLAGPLPTTVGLLFFVPAALMMLSVLLHYGLGLPITGMVGLLDSLKQSSFPAYRTLEVLTVLGPLVTFAVLTLPALDLQLQLREGRLSTTLTFNGTLARLALALLCVLVLGAFFSYAIMENAAEAAIRRYAGG